MSSSAPKAQAGLFLKGKMARSLDQEGGMSGVQEFERLYANTDSTSNVEITEEYTLNFQQESTNIFDSLKALAPPKISELGSELDWYLSSDMEHVIDPLQWWYECC